MNRQAWAFTVALLGVAGAAGAQVKSITVRAGGVLCLSCVRRVEMALQRVAGVEKVKVEMEPVRAEVTPRGGAWLDPERLRNAIKNAGFKPGNVRCTISGQLTEWRGQPAVALAGSERLLVLQAAPDAPQAFTQAQQMLAAGEGKAVEVEGQLVGPAVAHDPAAPLALRADRVVIAKGASGG